MKRRFYRNFNSGKIWKIIKTILKSSGLVVLVVLFLGLTAFVYYAKDLPRPEQFEERIFPETTKIFDRSGEHLLYEVYGEHKRTMVSLDKIPKHMRQAVVAAEDSDFYNHFGVDPEGILRAIWLDIKLGEFEYGGSTITQQLIRSTFLTNKKTLKRKAREAILALELDRRHSKEQILEWYLNQIPFGSNTYGVEAAAQVYFDKPASDLTLEESALLASLVKAPSYYSPYGSHREALMIRKNYILTRMAQENFISQKQAKQAKQKEINFANPSQFIKAPHFVMYVLEHYLKPKYGTEFLKQEGLEIYTSLDWELQRQAEQIVKEGVKRAENYGASNAALAAVKPQTGEIVAMVGSQNYFDEKREGQVNVAIRPQQPGSAFKPFAYTTAFKKGYTASTTVVDEKTTFEIKGSEDYTPRNYDGRFRGEITLRNALAQSINVPAVKVFVNLAGIEDTIKTAHEMGIKSELPEVPSLVLGSGGVKLLNMVSAYGTLATDGVRVDPASVLRIEDSEGKIIEQNKKSGKRVLRSEVARVTTDILSDNKARAPMFGPNSPLHFENYDVAAKTGTTNNFRDAWAIGYTDQIVVGVWAGNNDNSPMKEQPAVVVSGPIWHNFMEKAIKSFQ